MQIFNLSRLPELVVLFFWFRVPRVAHCPEKKNTYFFAISLLYSPNRACEFGIDYLLRFWFFSFITI